MCYQKGGLPSLLLEAIGNLFSLLAEVHNTDLDIASAAWQCSLACARSSAARGACAGAARAKHTSAAAADRCDSGRMQRGMRDSDARRDAVCSWEERLRSVYYVC